MENITHVSLITITSIVLRLHPWSQVVIELAPEHYEICGLVHICNFESTECGKSAILHALWKLVLPTRPSHAVWQLQVLIDNNAILIKLYTFFFHYGDMIGT